MFNEKEIKRLRIKSYRNIIECLQEELCDSISVNDKDYSNKLHESIWELRDMITQLTKEINSDITN